MREAKAIAEEAGVDDFLAEATPEDKKAIRKQIGALAAKAAAPAREVKELGERVQLYQLLTCAYHALFDLYHEYYLY